jgi:cytochrome c biogenesis protein CcmG, thiol:disulfide interchange protein DsbE
MNVKTMSLIGCLALALGAASAQSPGLAAGTSAPDFALAYLDGTATRLSAYRGKTVLLHFWATWCGPCVRELPLIDAMARDRKDIVVIAVECGEPRDTVAAFLKKNRMTLNSALDLSGSISQLYDVEAIPMSLIIDPNGKVSFSTVGAMSETQWRDVLGSAPKAKK